MLLRLGGGVAEQCCSVVGRKAQLALAGPKTMPASC